MKTFTEQSLIVYATFISFITFMYSLIMQWMHAPWLVSAAIYFIVLIGAFCIWDYDRRKREKVEETQRYNLFTDDIDASRTYMPPPMTPTEEPDLESSIYQSVLS